MSKAATSFGQGEEEAALADLSGNPDLLYRRGYGHESAGRHAEAMADYRAALGYAGADEESLLDGLARCENALGIGEDSHK